MTSFVSINKKPLVLVISALSVIFVSVGACYRLFFENANTFIGWPNYLMQVGLLLTTFLLLTIGVLWGDNIKELKKRLLVVGFGLLFVVVSLGGNYYKYKKFSNFVHKLEVKNEILHSKDCRYAYLLKKAIYHHTGDAQTYQDCDGVEKKFSPDSSDIKAYEKLSSIKSEINMARNNSILWLFMLFFALLCVWVKKAWKS